jgi:hypothetical protein
MQKVKGVGGIIFKPTKAREELLAWYRDQLGVDDQILDNEYGKFGWVFDPQGNRVELWQAH